MAYLLFEVITEHLDGDEIRKTVEYVTQESNSLEAVAIYFTRHCDEYEKDLKSVREVLSIVQHVPDQTQPEQETE